MKQFKVIITVVACLAFLVFSFFLQGDLRSQSIKQEMGSTSILKLNESAGLLIAEKDNESRVSFGKVDGCELFGVGALSTRTKEGRHTAGFDLESDCDDINLSQVPSDVLWVNPSPAGRYIAVITTNGRLEIIDTKEGHKTFELSDDSFLSCQSPLAVGQRTPLPYVFWCSKGLVATVSTQKSEMWGIPVDVISSIILIDPDSGEFKTQLFIDDESGRISAVAMIDDSTIVVASRLSDVQMQSITKYSALDINTGELSDLVRFSDEETDFLGMTYDVPRVFFKEDGQIKFVRLYSKHSGESEVVTLPEVDDKKLRVNELVDARITSRGYLFASIASLDKGIMIDVDTSYYILINNDRIPY
ncbi:MAG TPA: hypothetical protein PKV16_01995 [Caldisericia bacterium]|mgnify:CR=1 FL=1|nr:hypothetical protein [Caldisericia bacterium]HPF48085.1 hypothetical protein [Caldisericia bacterium]HPI83978.1 hypothetical protein [Caldisericia bacterium]HPQ92538.1 hypothetical protein [Caldisericia bacterium]HRV74364.1 hypothetical protein [Caldisericia bacterium]